MKKIARMLVFSALSIFITSLWNRGFVLPSSLLVFIQAVVVITFVYYLIVPLSKIILLPLNLLTLGLVSFLLYLFILHIMSQGFHLFHINSWTFEGITILGLTIPRTDISYLGNLVLSSLSLSSIINLLEHTL